jgi:hypothetical protein
MARDLTEALRALTDKATSGQTSRVDKALPERANPPAIPARSGSAGPVTTAAVGDSWELKGEKTWATSDGLFTIYFPETLESAIGGKTLTIGAIKAVTP